MGPRLVGGGRVRRWLRGGRIEESEPQQQAPNLGLYRLVILAPYDADDRDAPPRCPGVTVLRRHLFVDGRVSSSCPPLLLPSERIDIWHRTRLERREGKEIAENGGGEEREEDGRKEGRKEWRDEGKDTYIYIHIA